MRKIECPTCKSAGIEIPDSKRNGGLDFPLYWKCSRCRAHFQMFKPLTAKPHIRYTSHADCERRPYQVEAVGVWGLRWQFMAFAKLDAALKFAKALERVLYCCGVYVDLITEREKENEELYRAEYPERVEQRNKEGIYSLKYAFCK